MIFSFVFINKIMKSTIRIIGVIILSLVVMGNAFAQLPGLPSFPDTPNPAPIDNGLIILATLGVIYAVVNLLKREVP